VRAALRRHRLPQPTELPDDGFAQPGLWAAFTVTGSPN
jgi:hypothetical protein